MNYSIPDISRLSGIRTIPGDKSISHRALMIGAISEGLTEIQSCSRAEDPMSTFSCIRQLGIQVADFGDTIHVHGNGKRGLQQSREPLDAGNSGTTMRLLSGILIGQNFPTILIGDSSLSNRPMKRIIDPLRLMGANINGSERNTAPLNILPVKKLNPILYHLPVQSAQVKSSILFAGLFAEGITTVIEQVKTRDHTERMLGLSSILKDEAFHISVNSDNKLEAKKYFVPGDISAAAFYIAAGLLIPGSELRILNVGLNPTRRKILDIFLEMGGNIQIDNQRVIEGEPIGDLMVKSSELKSNLKLQGADVVELIDEIPILSITAMFAEGNFQIHDAKELRSKETDRIAAIISNMRLLGADIVEYEDGFEFRGNQKLKGCTLPSYHDHRIAMAFGIAGLKIKNVVIQDAECANISFPNFWKSLTTN